MLDITGDVFGCRHRWWLMPDAWKVYADGFRLNMKTFWFA